MAIWYAVSFFLGGLGDGATEFLIRIQVLSNEQKLIAAFFVQSAGDDHQAVYAWIIAPFQKGLNDIWIVADKYLVNERFSKPLSGWIEVQNFFKKAGDRFIMRVHGVLRWVDA